MTSSPNLTPAGAAGKIESDRARGRFRLKNLHAARDAKAKADPAEIELADAIRKGGRPAGSKTRTAEVRAREKVFESICRMSKGAIDGMSEFYKNSILKQTAPTETSDDPGEVTLRLRFNDRKLMPPARFEPGPPGTLFATPEQTLEEAKKDDKVKWDIRGAAKIEAQKWIDKQPERLQRVREELDCRQRMRMFDDADCWQPLTLSGFDDDDDD